MDYRTSITEALRQKISDELNGTKPEVYWNNLFGNVERKAFKFEEINEFPFIGLHIGPESFEYLPSRQQWIYLDISILLYVRDEGDVQDQLEKLIADVKTIIDSDMDLTYTINKPDGSTSVGKVTQITMNSVSTDEGLLDPFGFAEISVTCRYTPDKRLF